MNKYKLLAIDMDGTALTSTKKISSRTLNAVNNLLKRGVHVVTSTGRGLAELVDYREDFKLMNYGILISGGIVYDFFKGAPIATHAVDEETMLKLIDFGTAERAMIHLLTLNHSVAREVDIQHMNDFGMEIYFNMFNRICLRTDDFKQYIRTHPGEVFKVNLYHRDRASRDRNLERMSKLNLSIAFAESNNLEASPAGINKGSGLIDLCNFLNVDLSETVAIGDGFNDKEILQTAGFAVAMGNAREEIKQLANFVTLDNDNDGVANVIEKFF